VPKNIVVVNKRMFDGLDADVQAAVLEAAAVAEVRGWEMSAAEADSKSAELAAIGIVCYEPSAELGAWLLEICTTMLDNWKANASDSALAILDAFNN
jgi:TRAP-type C4-dicarboxylate transport system substrate-binding protein